MLAFAAVEMILGIFVIIIIITVFKICVCFLVTSDK